MTDSSAELVGFSRFDYIVKSGRALMYPVYWGTYERKPSAPPTGSALQSRELQIKWYQDFARSVDYLETRDDIDRNRVAYAGLSLGANIGPAICALETRVKTYVLVSGGFGYGTTLPEVDRANFAPRCRAPTLMLNGRHDFIFPFKDSQRPMFDSLGVAEGDKRHSLFEASHDLNPWRIDVQREVLAWLDRYLGPIN